MTRARVIGLGRRGAGDDAVGPAVIDHLRALGRDEVQLFEVGDALSLVPLFAGAAGGVVVLDAVALPDHGPGRVIVLDADELPGTAVRPVSSHGIDLARALLLARALGSSLAPAGRAWIVGVTIALPVRHACALTPAVAEAIPRAAEAALAHALGAAPWRG